MMNTLFPIICSLIIFLFPFAGRFRYNRQALNSIVISLGLLGTFAGITYALLGFDPENISSSLPQLLTGLKTTILTMISGVVTSLFLKLIPGFYGIRKAKDSLPENLPDTMKEILAQLIAIKDNIHKAGGVALNPDGTVQTTELFQDKALYDLARNTSQIMQKQSQYLSITQDENRRLYEQLQQLLQASQTTNENLETLLEKGIRNEENRAANEPTALVMKEMLAQLIAIKDNIHKAGVITNPDGSIQTTELFQDKALYDLARNTSEIMQKQSQYLSITQEENKRLYEQLQQLLQASQTTNENLESLLEKGVRQEENRSANEPTAPVMKEMLAQLIAIKENIHKAGVITNPDGSIQTTELFQDKALYDLARNTSEIMQKQSQYLSITQEENKRLYEQLQQLLQASQTTNENLESLLEKGIRYAEHQANEEASTPVMKEILSQLIGIKNNIHKAGTIINPDGSIQATELFQDKALYDLARNTSQIMQKQSQYLSITQEENRRLYEQLQQLLQASQTTNENLEALLEKGIRYAETQVSAEASTPVMKEILTQLIAIKDNIHKAGGVTLNPDGSVKTTELFQDKALYDLARNTSQIMQKQSQYLSITQEENRRLYAQLETLLLATQETNKNLETLIEKGVMRSNKKITAQVGELSELVKNTGEQVTVQIKQMNEKRAKETKELVQFVQTMQSIIKKLNQSHNALYKGPEGNEPEEKNS